MIVCVGMTVGMCVGATLAVGVTVTLTVVVLPELHPLMTAAVTAAAAAIPHSIFVLCIFPPLVTHQQRERSLSGADVRLRLPIDAGSAVGRAQ